MRKFTGWYQDNNDMVPFVGIIEIDEAGKFSGIMVEESQFGKAKIERGELSEDKLRFYKEYSQPGLCGVVYELCKEDDVKFSGTWRAISRTDDILSADTVTVASGRAVIVFDKEASG